MEAIQKIIQIAKETINIEQKAIANLEHLIDDEFAEAINSIYKVKGELLFLELEKVPILQQKLLLH